MRPKKSQGAADMAAPAAQSHADPLDSLLMQIRDLYETDRGDFKRKALLYLNRFEEAAPQALPFAETRAMILCDFSPDIEALRRKILCALKGKKAPSAS